MPDRSHPGDVVAAHLDAWNMPAGPERDRAVAEIYTQDVLVGEPDRVLEGHAGVSTAIAGLQAQLPGTALHRSGPIRTVQDLVTYVWGLAADGQPPVASGRDVLFLRDGRVSAVYVLIDPADEPDVP